MAGSNKLRDVGSIADPAQITSALSLILEPGQVTELRALDATTADDRRPHTFGGYFDDPHKLAAAVGRIASAKGIYIVPNPIKPALLARSMNKANSVGKNPTTADHDIDRRHWLLIDCDPVRPAGISASDDEHDAALAVATDIDAWLAELRWPPSIIADSGNGGHLLFRIDEPRDDGELVKRCLEALAARFNDDRVTVDTSVFNPARIWKCYGTLAGKGDADAASIGRPQRLARIINAPAELTAVDHDKLVALADSAPRSSTSKPAAATPGPSGSFDLEAWLRRHNLELDGPQPWQGGRRWVFKVCPWNSDHTNRSAFLIQHAGGAIAAGCHHDGCKGRTWHDLRDALEPGCRSKPRRDRHDEPAAVFEPVLVRLSDVTSRPVEWLWPGRFALGKLSLVAGDPGLGKSFLTLDMAARISCGNPWPDDPLGTNPAGDVVLLSAEDDLEDTIRPRLDTMGADVRRIHALTTVKLPNGKLDAFNLGRDLPSLEQAVASTHGCRLVVIDPITAYCGGTDSHKNADVRALLAPLAEFAMRRRVAVVAVTHLNKNAAGSALYRTMGSLAFIAAARAGFVVVKDKQNPARRLFLSVKNNLASDLGGLAYSLIDSAVAWERDPVNISADDALAIDKPDARSGKRAAEQAWLKGKLAGGPKPAGEVLADGEGQGFSAKTLRNALRDLAGDTFRESFGGPWYWRLPAQDAHEDSQDTPSQDTGILGILGRNDGNLGDHEPIDPWEESA